MSAPEPSSRAPAVLRVGPLPAARSALRVVFAAAGLALAVHACAHAADPRPERAWSVQLHLHGPFSEGLGSIDSHSHEARGVGCDVLWWSEHDFRLTGYNAVTCYGFEGPTEPQELNERWTTGFKSGRGESKGVRLLSQPAGARVEFVDAPVRQGEQSLFLGLSSPREEVERLTAVFLAAHMVQRRCLATGLSVRLAVWPEPVQGDGWVVVEVELSEHAPRLGLGLEPRTLRYELSPRPGAPERRGATYVVPLACEPGRWNEIVLPITVDALRGFPESPAEDNSMFWLTFGAEARRGGSAGAFFDDLRIESLLSGLPVYARQKELVDEVAGLYPGLTQLQGIEISCKGRHLNLFCEDTPLPDYAALARTLPSDPERPGAIEPEALYQRAIEWVVAETHRRGGLVSYNHPFGASFEGGDEGGGVAATVDLSAELSHFLACHAEGADLLEVGYRARGGATLDDHLWLWDQAALAGLRLVGTGVSDSHGGPEGRWRGTPNNFVSWIWAPEPSKAQLIAGLRAGRVFFGDLERFQGTLDLWTATGEHMGATRVTEDTEARVTLEARGTQAGQRVVLVESGRRTQTFPVEGESFRGEVVLALAPGQPAFVRFELLDASGPIALSNPIHFVRPSGDAPGPR